MLFLETKMNNLANYEELYSQAQEMVSLLSAFALLLFPEPQLFNSLDNHRAQPDPAIGKLSRIVVRSG